jgi:hypothetical protein
MVKGPSLRTREESEIASFGLILKDKAKAEVFCFQSVSVFARVPPVNWPLDFSSSHCSQTY